MRYLAWVLLGLLLFIVVARAEEIPVESGSVTLIRAELGTPRDDANRLARISRGWANAVDGAPNHADAQKAAQQALAFALQAVKADPKNAQAHLALAIASGKWTDFVDAKTKIALSRQIRSEAEKAISLDPKQDLAYLVLGRWHLSVAGVNPFLRFGARLTVGTLPPASMEEAARNLERAVELSPKTVAPHQYLALAYQALGKHSEAMTQWRAVLDLPATDREDEEAKRQARAALER